MIYSYTYHYNRYYKPKINSLLYQFYIYLADAKIKEINSVQQIQNKKEHYYSTTNIFNQGSNTISWIEKLLQTQIDDYRKNAVSLILAPYLINVKKLSYDSALNIINSWLSKCEKLRKLDQNFDYMVRYALKNCVKNGYRPLKFDTLKMKNNALYHLLISDK